MGGPKHSFPKYLYIERETNIYIYIYWERERERGRAKPFFLESLTKSWDTIEETKEKTMLILVIKWLVADDTTEKTMAYVIIKHYGKGEGIIWECKY